MLFRLYLDLAAAKGNYYNRRGPQCIGDLCGENICVKRKEEVTGKYNGKDRNRCPNRSMEVELSVLLGNYDLQTDRPTKRTDRRGHREGILPTTLQQEKKGKYRSPPID